MLILVYSKINSHNIHSSIGQIEYSYYFVLRKFLPVLKEIGKVQTVSDPLLEVDDFYEKALKEGMKCIFLCFTAPHNSFIDLKCPTIPVFAWEYDTIPNEEWDGNEKNNWVMVLRKLGAAITHSHHSVEVVQSELGLDFPIISCPAPMALDQSNVPIHKLDLYQQYELKLTKEVIDTSTIYLAELDSKKNPAQRIEITHLLLRKWAYQILYDQIPEWLFKLFRSTYYLLGTFVARSLRLLRGLINNNQRKSNSGQLANPDKKINTSDNSSTISISGVIYTSILNILDGRKNYQDMVAAFCHALNDKEDATLIIKTPVLTDLPFFKEKVFRLLQRLRKFKCRIVIIGYYLDDKAYSDLMKASTFYVNTSFGEGQCLPLMEYMAAGIPSIAPYASALKDYIKPANSLLVKTNSVPTTWQHDERMAIRTVHHRPDWYSLVEAYRTSYQMAKKDQKAYQKMSLKAKETLTSHTSFQGTKEKLEIFLKQRLRNIESSKPHLNEL